MQHVSAERKQTILKIFLSLCLFGVHGNIYDDNTTWTRDSCADCLQSPVNIVTHGSEKIKLAPLEFSNYDQHIELQMHNDGNTVSSVISKDFNASVTGGNLNDLFIVSQILLHWPAEHMINFVEYDFELQILHYNNAFENVPGAFDGVNGFMMMAILFKAVKSPTHVPPGLLTICDILHHIRTATHRVKLLSITMDDLIVGVDKEKYFIYCGSLTQPPCTTNVIWIVFSEPMEIEEACIYQLKALQTDDGRNMTSTRRTVSLMEGRRVFYVTP